MGITFYSPQGSLLSYDDMAGPWQLNSEGLNTGLERNSRPFENFIFNTRTYQLLYQHQLWVKVAVDKLTFQMSRLPLKVYEGESAEKKRLTSGPLFDSIHSPAPGKRAGTLVQWGIKPALIQGASALRIVRNSRGTPTGYLPLYWQWLDPRTVDGVPDGLVDFYRYTPPGVSEPEILMPDDVVLIAWETADGRVGDSPLRPLLETLMIEYLAKRHMQQMLRNGVRPPGGISWGDGSPELIQLAQDAGFRQRFTEELERLYGGAAGKPLNLPPGAKWQAFGYSNTDAEMIAHRKLTPIEVAAGYDIAPPNIGWLEGMARSGLEVLAPSLFTVTLPPWLSLFQDAFGGQVIDRTPAFAGQSLEFDLGDALRGDPVNEVNALKTAVLSGLRTINEARAKLNLPPSADAHADELMFAENNMTFLGGMPMRDPAAEPAAGSVEAATAKALLASAQRAGERVYRRLKAGEPPVEAWDASRFERELRDDLEQAGANGTADRRAKAFTEFVGALVTAADGDADAVRTNFAPFATT